MPQSTSEPIRFIGEFVFTAILSDSDESPRPNTNGDSPEPGVSPEPNADAAEPRP